MVLIELAGCEDVRMCVVAILIDHRLFYSRLIRVCKISIAAANVWEERACKRTRRRTLLIDSRFTMVNEIKG